MGDGNGEDGPAQDILSHEGFVAVQAKLGNGAPQGRLDGLVENVGKTPEELVLGSHWAVDRHVPLRPEPKNAQIVRTVNVIGMKMGEPDRVHLADTLANQLKPQLRWRIHQELASLQGEKSAVSSPAIPGIVRRAGGTRAADHGNPEGGACAEEGQLHAGLRGSR
jgi:hypothetical protein